MSRNFRQLMISIFIVCCSLIMGYPDSVPAQDEPGFQPLTRQDNPNFKPPELVVSTNPEGIQVIIDGHVVGTSPVSIVGLDPGTHEVYLEAPGFKPLKKNFKILSVPGKTESVSFSLELLPFNVSTTPPGATVYLDNVAKGITPFAMEGVTVGEHNVRITLDGHKTVLRKIDFKPGTVGELENVALVSIAKEKKERNKKERKFSEPETGGFLGLGTAISVIEFGPTVSFGTEGSDIEPEADAQGDYGIGVQYGYWGKIWIFRGSVNYRKFSIGLKDADTINVVNTEFEFSGGAKWGSNKYESRIQPYGIFGLAVSNSELSAGDYNAGDISWRVTAVPIGVLGFITNNFSIGGELKLDYEIYDFSESNGAITSASITKIPIKLGINLLYVF